MTQWQEVHMLDKIIGILENYRYDEPEKYGGHAYASAYQIAIDFAKLYPEDVKKIGFPLGGRGSGSRNSLVQYIAGQLRREIVEGKNDQIEFSYLHVRYMTDLIFKYEQEPIEATMPGTDFHVSMFRLKA